MSIKYITANVVDRNNGRIVTTASTVEHTIKNSLECGRTCNAKAAAIVGEVLAMRLKVEGLQDGQGRGIHADVKKEIEKKGFKSRTKPVRNLDLLMSGPTSGCTELSLHPVLKHLQCCLWLIHRNHVSSIMDL